MKQTAVLFMANELLHLENEFDMKLIDKNEYQIKRKQIIEQAKEMFEEQIKDAFSNGCLCHSKTSEQYYNETFKSE
jgi:hypothetical protein